MGSDHTRTTDQIHREIAYYKRELSRTKSVSRKDRAARRLAALRIEVARRRRHITANALEHTARSDG